MAWYRQGSAPPASDARAAFEHHREVGQEAHVPPFVANGTGRPLPAAPLEVRCDLALALTLLYQLIYEGSSDLYRIDDRFKSDDSMLWHFKHMRLIETHDVHHGDPGQQAKQMREVGEAFLHFGGNLEPRAPNEWGSVHTWRHFAAG